MADFVDSEAEESDEEHSDEEIPVKSRKIKKQLVDSDEEEDDDDEGEVNDLIDDNPIEEDSDNESDRSGRKRKRSDDEDDFEDRLEDDDYELLEENLGIKVQRKYKRITRPQEADSDDEEATRDTMNDRHTVRSQMEGSDNEEERGAPNRDVSSRQYASDESEGEYSDADDFIVDDKGRPIAEKRKKRKPIFADSTLQEAQDIFGVDFDYDDFEKYDDEYYDEEEDEDEDQYEDEEQRTERISKKTPRRRRKPKSIYEIYEPSELERAGFTDDDNRIRTQDIPERMQIRSIPVTPAQEDELDEEAEWIYDRAFSKLVADNYGPAFGRPMIPRVEPSIAPSLHLPRAPGTTYNDFDGVSKSGRLPQPAQSTTGWDDAWDNATVVTTHVDTDISAIGIIPINRTAEEVKAKYIKKIKKSLEFMRNQQLEVPFIAFYRKEYIDPELTSQDLWTIYRLDAKFCQLRSRKLRLVALYKNMKEFQTEQILAHRDEPIPDSTRIISEEDIEHVKNIKTHEELKDVYSQFSIFYSQDVEAMKAALKAKKRKEKQVAREQRDGEEEEGQKEDDDEDKMDEDDDKVPQIKRKVGSGSYGLCRKFGIDGLAKRFGLSPAKFAQNLRDAYQRFEVDQEPTDPLEVAKEYVSPRLTNPEDVLKAAKFMVAMQLSREPLVRQSVREVFFERAKISVAPTKRGLKEIDESHPLFPYKFIKNKPVTRFTNDLFLRLSTAEDDGLLKLTIGDMIAGLTHETYTEEVRELYRKDEFTKNVLEWNKLRGECVEFALEKQLYPVLRKELRARLVEQAKEHVLKECAKKLFDCIKFKPYVPHYLIDESEERDDDDDWDLSKGLRVLAIAYVPDLSQASFACFINGDGEPSDYLRLQNIIKQKSSFKDSDRIEKEADILALKNFIRLKRPHVLVIGGESREALMIKQDLHEIVGELRRDDGFPCLSVEVLDNEDAKVYANSLKATNDFRDYPLLLRQAISLGRRLQDPLIEYSQLCTPDDEILCLNFHPLQEHVAKEDLLDYLHVEFINRINEVGVDVNRALACPHSSNLVQFVCGLGPRKAVSLLKTLKQNNQRLENRTQLITVCHMGPKVFINCSGFIKIDTNSLGDSTEAYVEVLDGMRIHPEAYEWARKMAVDAADYSDDDEANPASALEEILENPERLKDLDLDAFADELYRQGFGEKGITLYDIRKELTKRYEDIRVQYHTPDPEDLFYMLTKETPETLHYGKLITASVVGISHKKPQADLLDNAVPQRDDATGMWQCSFCGRNDFPDLSEVWNHFDANACPGQAIGVRIRLDNGVSGFIPISKLSDKAVPKPEDRVKRGQIVHCRITKIDVNRFSVDCTSRSSDLSDVNGEFKPAKDEDYDVEAEERETKKDHDAKQLKLKQTYVKRVIVHPSFKNISYRDAEKMMEQMDQGEVIIRPSSKGSDHLTVTWKVTEGVYQHIDVKEEGKENQFSLGTSLRIGNDEFEDLDEILARYVNPMASYARDIMNFRYFKPFTSRQEAEEFLKGERERSANKIHYVLFASKEYPGKFILAYLPKHKAHHEYITIKPDGFRFRNEKFDSLGLLFKWFKEHYRDPPPSVTPSATPNINRRTPYATTPGHADARSTIGPPAPSVFGGPGPMSTHATPHFATPANYTPYNSYTPYTPTAQTPNMNMTPYQPTTPLPSSQGNSGFIHPPSATVIGVRGSQQSVIGARSSHQSSRGPPKGNTNSSGGPGGELDWRKAAEQWAKQQQKAPPGYAQSYAGEGSRTPATRNAAQVISEGIQKTRQMSSSAQNYFPHHHHKSPRTGHDSLKSTPKTNFSPRSMIESSLGDETPLYDEN